jgi:hypothetical protein
MTFERIESPDTAAGSLRWMQWRPPDTGQPN